MKITITLLCLLCSTACFSQRLTYNDLYFGLSHTTTQVQDKLLATGLAYDSTIDLDSTKNNKNVLYAKNSDNLDYIGFAFMTFKNETYGCTITTLKPDESNKLIQEIKKQGFTLYGSEKYGTNMYTQYRKGELEVEIQIGTTDNGNTMFSITLRDIAKTKAVYK